MITLDFTKILMGPGGKMNLKVQTEIAKESLVTLYGKSGVGKTTLLRIVSGLMNPDKGSIKMDGDVWFDSTTKTNVTPQKRNVGFVFQDYALFPNMTVQENLSFAVEKRANPKIIDDLIELVELGDLRHRKPATLSGGQQQRVALARALVKKPTILMLDEPLSALDFEIRYKLQEYILKVHKEYKLTTILISHDISEILRLSDKIIEIDNGKIINQGRPFEIFGTKKINTEFQFTGTILAILREHFLYILTIRIGNDVVKVVADESEATDLHVGDTILVASKAFNPVITKIKRG